MSTGKNSQLDVDELLAIAVTATQRGQVDRATKALEEVVARAPDNAYAYHLMGGIHASAGNRVEAIRCMSRAVELDPDLAQARFQLGLFRITSGEVAEAQAVWEPLEARGNEDYLVLFKRGMLHLISNAFAACVADIEAGIARNAENRALNREMAKIADRARRAMPGDGKRPG